MTATFERSRKSHRDLVGANHSLDEILGDSSGVAGPKSRAHSKCRLSYWIVRGVRDGRHPCLLPSSSGSLTSLA
jgi:hypothetical protein